MLRDGYFIMAIALALLVSDEPVTIRQFSHALQELALSTEVCQEAESSIPLSLISS
jgi:hypothetical protein